MRARWLAARERREGHCARTAQQAAISGRAQGTAGDVCVSLQASPPNVATQGQRGTRWSPSYRRGRAKEARGRTVALLRYVDVAGCTAPRLARGGTLLRTSRRSGVHDWHKRLAAPFGGLCRSQHGDLRYYIAANDDYFRPSHRRPLLQCCRRLATPSLVAFATDQIYRSLERRVTTATPMPKALDFMGGLTIKPS